MNPESRSVLASFAISLLLHGLLIWSVMRWNPAPVVPIIPTMPMRVTMRLVAPAPPKEEPLPSLPKSPVELVINRARNLQRTVSPPHLITRSTPSPLVVPESFSVPESLPPQHKMKAASAIAPSTVTGGARKGSVYAPPDYAEKVKVRVNAAIVYPADAKHFLQQCWVEYTLIVDRNGRMLSYKINNCGDDRLDAAAEAALIKGGPYPPPPDTGASSYEIFGAIVFTLH